MVHMWHIEDGRARYRNRWVRTTKWTRERAAGRALWSAFDPMQNDPSVVDVETNGLANTNVVWHGNKLLALEEGHAPFELDPRTLESLGPWTFDGRLSGPMTAHPKMDPETGEMLFFGYMVDGPFGAGMSYNVVGRDGKLTRSETFQAPIASMVHDFIATDEHVIFPIFPLTGSVERAMKGEPAFAWEPGKGTHVGVMRRDGSVGEIRWFETDPCYVFHPMNAFTDGNRIVAHMMQFEEAPLFPHADGTAPDPAKARARLSEWTIDLADNGRGVARRYVDDVVGEFPRLDERFAGLEYRYGYYAGVIDGDDALGFNAIVRHDFAKDRRAVYSFAAGDVPGEPVFVAKGGRAKEGEGYLLATVYRGAEHRSDLAVFDAESVERGPLACVQLPHRVPYGFHGNWRAA
jgi:carotenoid cleavage dioxygenase